MWDSSSAKRMMKADVSNTPIPPLRSGSIASKTNKKTIGMAQAELARQMKVLIVGSLQDLSPFTSPCAVRATG